MKPNQFVYKTLLFTLLGLSICQFAHAEKNHPLTGTWSSQCAANDSGGFMIETFKFADTTAVYSTKTFSDPACKTEVSDLMTDRDFKLGDATDKSSDTHKLDYVFKSVTMTYTDASSVTAANKAPGYYGFTDWKLNQPKKVSGLKKNKASSPERNAGEKFYTIVKIDNDKLYMGDYNSGAGTSDAKRLSAIYKISFIREN